MDNHKLTIIDLQELCADGEEETLILEFKSCDELRAGSTYRDKKGETQTRSRDFVIDELSKDVSALLNATGGRIIYGIREKKSRAKSLDDKAYTPTDNLTPEKLVDWLRAHIQPSPTVNVSRVFTNPDDDDSSWYFVIEVEQGQQAYMARDNRFYKRVGATVKPMEQYEVVDTMNRSKGALLRLEWDVHQYGHPTNQNSQWNNLILHAQITCDNLIPSEYGKLKLWSLWPMRFDTRRSLKYCK